MENKLIIFDLDGVLLDSRDLHFHALNSALEKIDKKYVISYQEHLSMYDGLSTTKKLTLLNKQKGLNPDSYDEIWKNKQKATMLEFNNLPKNTLLIHLFQKIKQYNIKIAVASNSIRETVKLSLLRLGVMEYVDYYASNEDVKRTKPYPEIFWNCMIAMNSIPKNTVIFEDSHIGREAAINSGATLIDIKDSLHLTEEKIDEALMILQNNKTTLVPWRDKKMNVLIPMAGAGSRFAQAGYTFPKPLIEINNKPMIQQVVENLNIDAHYIFIVQQEHYGKYNLKQFLNLISPNCDIITVDGVTEGAACTTLLAKELIDNNRPLLIANSDQFVEWNSNECLYAFNADGIDAGIVTFNATHPKWSFVKLDENGFVSAVAEKNPISNIATVGIYYWRNGSDYVKYAEQMIKKNIRTNNEFYVCPVFNEAILDNKKIRIKMIEKMWGLGTPEDLNFFMENFK